MSNTNYDLIAQNQEEEYLMYMHGYHALHAVLGKEKVHQLIDQYINDSVLPNLFKSLNYEDNWGDEDREFLEEMLRSLQNVKKQIG